MIKNNLSARVSGKNKFHRRDSSQSMFHEMNEIRGSNVVFNQRLFVGCTKRGMNVPKFIVLTLQLTIIWMTKLLLVHILYNFSFSQTFITLQ